MSRNKLELFIHFVWATWDRQPLILPAIERRIYRVIESEAKGLGCDVLAIGGMMGHVHVFITLSTTVSIAHLVKQMKGVSSYFVNEVLRPTIPFKWQGYYGAFSIGESEVKEVIEYINHQKQHHRDHLFRVDLETCLIEDKKDDNGLRIESPSII